MAKTLEHELRKKIYDLISKNPGLHFSKIAEILNIRNSLAKYHLSYMEKNNLIYSIKEKGGYHRRYYKIGAKLGVDDKKILALLRQEMPYKIILFLLKKRKLRHRDILKNLDISSSTLSYYINRLVADGIIHVSADEEKGYSLINRKKIIQLLLKYEQDKILGDFRDVWEDLHHLE
jgi:predicted transcriptional regulator